MIKYLRYPLALIIGFIIILIGSVDIPKIVLPALYGPYPVDGNIPVIRILTDFCISFVFTMLGGYLAALITPSKPILFGTISGILYFCLSAYWYSGYSLVGSEWVSPVFMLVKVPVAAYIGAFLYQKYNKSSQQDTSKAGATA